MNDQAPLVQLENVSVNFDSMLALENVSLRMAPGTVLGVIGPNGGGKTTLLRVVLGEVVPTSGTVRVFGIDSRALGPVRNRIGYVPQRTVVNPRFPISVREVVAMGAIPQAGLLRRVPRDIGVKIDAILERVGLRAKADQSFHTLSGGEQQRAIIARALLPGAELLLLDEPTGAIDTTGQTQVLELLRELQHDLSIGMILVSHHIGETLPYVDRVACLNRTLHWHDEAELLSEQVLREVYACELDAYFLKHHAHQETFHAGDANDPHQHHHH